MVAIGIAPLAAAGMLLFTAGTAADPEAAERTIERAAQALESGKAGEAVGALWGLTRAREFARLAPALQVRARAILGLAAEATADPELAASSLLEALDEPVESVARDLAAEGALALARSFLEMKDPARALEALARLGPEERSGASGLAALARYAAGDASGAEAAFEEAFRAQPSGESAYYLGVIRFDRGEMLAALKRFEEAARLEPATYYVHVYRARALLELERAEEAVKVLASLPGGPGSPEAQYLLGKAHLRLGRFEEAAPHFQRAIEANPGYGEAHFGLLTALRRLGNLAEGKAVLEKFQTLHADEAARLRRADALSQVALRSPQDPRAAEELARFHLDTGELEGAERYAWRAVRLDPTRQTARLLLARALARSGRYTAAAVQYRRILEAEPSEMDARRELEALIREHARR